MEKKTKLQIPMSIKLKKSLEQKSEDLGFSSANELMRVIAHHFVKGNISLEFAGIKEYAPMIDEATEKRLAESLADYKAGRYETIDMSKPNAIKNWLNDLDV
ncbi:MAG: hypothetical protein HOA17_02195 [Candidatus Melainabacteria bacterium]|jgi:hypothetical protein|nr:hypothetical protein [Candidatus Melainabacteria bacterium]